MLAPDRRRRVVDELRRRGSATVEQLSAALDVSSSTVRRDLAMLEADGVLLRAHGGAYLPGSAAPAQSSTITDPSTAAVKERIARTAAGRIVDGMTVMILSGSTTTAMLPHLAGRTITVVTNGLDVGYALAAHPEITLVLLGGMLHRDQMTLLGPISEQSMADLHVDMLFGGAWGVHPETGVTGAKIAQAGYHHGMLRHTDSLVVLADGTKFGRRGPTRLAGIDQVDEFVTDPTAPADVLDALRAQGAAVTVCPD